MFCKLLALYATYTAFGYNVNSPNKHDNKLMRTEMFKLPSRMANHYSQLYNHLVFAVKGR